MSIQDIKKGEIQLRYLLLIVDFSYLYAYVGIIIILFFYRYVEKYIGGADLLIFCLLTSRYGIVCVSTIALYSSLLALIYCVIKKQNSIRFIPFILLGFIIS